MFNIIHSDGSSDDNPSIASLYELYDEILIADREHGDVAVVHEESGWSLSAHRDGRVVFENLRSGGERHMIPVSREKMIDLWQRLIAGDVDSLLREPWHKGYVQP